MYRQGLPSQAKFCPDNWRGVVLEPKLQTAEESGGSSPTTSAFLRHSNSSCSRILHPGLTLAVTRSQAEQLESILQNCAFRVIYPFTQGMSCSNILFVAELTSLESRRDQLSRSFFQDISHPSSSLCHLLPPPRDTSVLSRLRTATRFTRPISRTKNIVPLLIAP